MSSRFTATLTGRSLGDHVCWPFHGPDHLVTSARQYVREGVDRHERVAFWQLRPTGMHHAVLTGEDQVGRRPGSAVPVLTPMTPEPGWTPSTSPLGPLGHMTARAVADGYTGLRVLTDATELARHPETRRQWVRSEHLLDRYAVGRPLAMVCGYDADELDDEPLADVASVHAWTGERLSPFLLRATDRGLALSGEVDRGCAMRLYAAVLTVGASTPGPLVIDLSDQVFLDHTALVALHRAARTLGTTVTLVGASPLTALLVDAFALTGVTVEEAP